MFPGHLLSRPDSQADVLLGGAHLFAQHHLCQWRQDHAGTTFPRESLSQGPTTLSSSCIMHICLRICNLPHFCGFRMKTWSWPKWSCWGSLWRGIWPWLSSKRARWKPEYPHFLLYIKFKHYKPRFNNKTVNQTCSERIYFCSCSNHITSSRWYRPDTKNQNVTFLSQDKQ